MKIQNIVLVLVFASLMSIQTYAQRLNKHGLKMVSEVEYYYDGGNNCLLKFKYDTNDKLSRMTVYWNGEIYRDFIKTEKGLTLKNYEDDYYYDFVFDCYDNISKIYTYYEFEVGSVVRREYDLHYEKDEKTNTFSLISYDRTETSKRKGQNSWYGTSCGTWNIYVGDKKDVNNENDTNINLEAFHHSGGDNLFRGGALWFLPVTEWMNYRPRFKYNDIKCDYDNCNNLIQVEDWFLDKLQWKINIKYVY